jgi:hypothetical protein
MARKIVFFLTVGVITGALAGLAIADFTGEVPQFAAAEMSAESGFSAVGGVADYWPEDSNTNLAQERGPVETGALPETSGGPANDSPTVEIGGLMYRIDIDSP